MDKKYAYTIGEYPFRGNENDYEMYFEFADPEQQLLGELLMSDVDYFPDHFKEALDLVLSGEKDHYTTGGNVFSVDIDPDFCEFSTDLIPGDGTESVGRVETRVLRQLVEEWTAAKADMLRRHPRKS